MISAVILTKNEEANITRCIKSVLWCDEIIVVDDYSNDNTINLIQNLKCKSSTFAKATVDKQNYNEKFKIYKRSLDNNFAGQRNFGLEKAKGDWILFVDSDEVVSDNLRKEIIKKIQKNDFNGYFVKRNDFFLGKWLQHGETSRVKQLRLARKKKGLWVGKIHEKWEIKGKVGILSNPLLHFPHPNVASFLKKINTYTDIVAQYWKEQGRKINFIEIMVYPSEKFLQNYLVRGGFLDGVPGFIMACMMSFHSFLARGKYWLLINSKKRNE